MRLYNTMTNQKEDFKPIDENTVKMYVCGPTVYNFFHLGNARPFIIFDVLRRYFIYKGYDVKYIQNFTDVDDKIIKAANEAGITSKELSEKYIAEYFADVHALGIQDADANPKVSEHIKDIVGLIEDLVAKGFAYNVDGNVYFRVSAFPEYGKLSKQPLDDLMSGARIEVNDEKENPLDFSLWKKYKEGEPYWESPWGKGRPGWHIECSAMSRAYLGETIDIHGGGQDLIFPHHENEIAQSEAANGKPFVNYWLHNGYINVDNVKMSKSLGNFFMIRDILKEFDPEVVRLFILSVHYRNPLNFSDESLKQIENGLERLYNVKNDLLFKIDHAQNSKITTDEKQWTEALQKHINDFEASMEDDINTAKAVSALFEMGKDINIHTDEHTSKEALQAAYNSFMRPAEVLGLLAKSNELLDTDIQKLIDERQQARADKDFKRADEIRDILKAEGILLEDTREGVKWKRS